MRNVVFALLCACVLAGSIVSSGCASNGSGSGSTPAPVTSDLCPITYQPKCGANCCDYSAVCVDDGTGTKICATKCGASAECPPAKGCCTALKNNATGQPESYGACMPAGISNSQNCRCKTAAECPGGTCGESTNTSGNPTGLAVCVPIDGQPYHGCLAGSVCNGGYCCVNITGTDSSICQEPCHDDSQCGGAKCSMFTSGSCGGAPGGCQ